MAAKTQSEKLLEKQIKEQQKIAKQNQCLSETMAIVDGDRVVNGFRVMDDDSDISKPLYLDTIMLKILVSMLSLGRRFNCCSLKY